MKSMTGYGKGEWIRGERRLSIELKSVNHRFLDICIKMPRQFNFAEDILRKELQSHFARGHIDLYLTYEDKSSGKAKFAVDDAVLQNYLEVAKYLQDSYNLANDITTTSVMRFADILVEEKQDADERDMLDLLNKAINEAISGLVEMREQEGKTLQNDFVTKIAKMEMLIGEVAKRAPLVVAEYKDKLRCRIKEAMYDIDFDEARLINEVAFFADRSCIDEEITRLRSHIVQFGQVMQANEPIGRKLDFLLQEMNREVNTIGAKANDEKVTKLVVELKTELEKLREQIQNIE